LLTDDLKKDDSIKVVVFGVFAAIGAIGCKPIKCFLLQGTMTTGVGRFILLVYLFAPKQGVLFSGAIFRKKATNVWRFLYLYFYCNLQNHAEARETPCNIHYEREHINLAKVALPKPV